MIARWFGLAIGMVGLFATVGCWSDDGLAQRYAVNGTVNYKGKPLEKGIINFTPEIAEGRGASGAIKDGNFTLTTNEPDDGAFPGKYKVTIADVVIDLAAANQDLLKQAAKGGGAGKVFPGTVDPAMLGKMAKKAKNNVPTKYATAASTPLTAEVKAESNSFTFDLTD